MIAALVPQEDWSTVWHLCAAMLRPAFEHGRDYAVEDAPVRLDEGTWQLWIVVDRGSLIACCVTEVVDFPQRRKLWVVAAGGAGRQGVRALWPHLTDFAHGQGCAVVEFSGRRGWARSGFLPEGWSHRADLVEVPL